MRSIVAHRQRTLLRGGNLSVEAPQAESPAPQAETQDELTEIRARLENSVDLVRGVTQLSGPSLRVEEVARALPQFGATRARQVEMVGLQASISAWAIDIDRAVDELNALARSARPAVLQLDAPPLWDLAPGYSQPAVPETEPELDVLTADPAASTAVGAAYRFLLEVFLRSMFRGIGIFAFFVVVFVLLRRRAPEWRDADSAAVRHLAHVVERPLARRLAVGEIEFSVGSVVVLLIIVSVAVLASRVVRFFLAGVYARIALEHGTGVVISKLVHYTLLTVGTLVGLGAAGFELNRFAVLMGALGVGIGFGLQTIVNNFMSGLILLFERPLSVGDIVTVGEVSGKVLDIGIRGTRIQTWDGGDVTVPNANLVSGEFTNWNFTDERRRKDLAVGVAYGTDPARVSTILVEAANEHPAVLDEPEPVVLFADFGDSSLDFVLRYWSLVGDFVSVSSDLHTTIYERLTAAQIEIPFPQRDLHVKSDTDVTREADHPR